MVSLPASGPSLTQVEAVRRHGESPRQPNILIVDATQAVARRLLSSQRQTEFSEVFPTEADAPRMLLGRGDTVEISVWEAPPALLFGASAGDNRTTLASGHTATLPTQMINGNGDINVPFVGLVRVAGRTTQDVESELMRRLASKANLPQVMLRLIRNASSNVTIVGEVSSSTRMPLTASGERLLDALAAAGGVRQPVSKMTLQVTRGTQVHAMPLELIIRDPKQNVLLHAGDVVTALNQPLSFTVLGAMVKNEEVAFEAQGISLAQALARSGGLHDSQADARGVFLFRFEEAQALTWPEGVQKTPEGKVPVIYQVDLTDPANFFVAQSFPIKNRDVLYVANAPAAELQKFLNIVTSIATPILGVVNVTR